MSNPVPRNDPPDANDVRSVWEANAKFWDGYFKEGNEFHDRLVRPAAELLLRLSPGEHVLDIACGNGAFSRQMANRGVRVTAFDFSQSFIDCARARSASHAGRIEYRTLDATNADDLASLGTATYDAAVCNMALMDMSDIDPLAESIRRLLKTGGRFVFTIMHPCFNHAGSHLFVEEEPNEDGFRVVAGVRITRYMSDFSSKGIGIRGQPVPQYYFHRPLHALLAPFLAQGLAMTGLVEKSFAGQPDVRPTPSWDHVPEIPPVLGVRLDRIAGS